MFTLTCLFFFFSLQTIPFSYAICIPDLKSNLKTYTQRGSKSPLQSNICLANMEETKQPKQNHFPWYINQKKILTQQYWGTRWNFWQWEYPQ